MITQQIVTDDKRLDFIPSITQKYIHFESAIYQYASKHIEGYNGAYWVFVELSNGGKYMYPYPEANAPVRLCNTMNWYEGDVSHEAAGIAISAMVIAGFAAMAHSTGDLEQSQHFTELFHQLRDFALEHNEASEILAFLD